MVYNKGAKMETPVVKIPMPTIRTAID